MFADFGFGLLDRFEQAELLVRVHGFCFLRQEEGELFLPESQRARRRRFLSRWRRRWRFTLGLEAVPCLRPARKGVLQNELTQQAMLVRIFIFWFCDREMIGLGNFVLLTEISRARKRFDDLPQSFGKTTNLSSTSSFPLILSFPPSFKLTNSLSRSISQLLSRTKRRASACACPKS
jgi:hypothetical protein